MYEVLKSLANRLFPHLLISQEETLRKILAWRYKGRLYQCNICETQLSSFILRENGDRLCPRCGSVGRTRRLYSILSDHGNSKRVLHFSPPKALKKQLSKFKTFIYKTTDYEGEFEADYNYDITQIDSPNEQYDLIICYHVLEHIVEDQKAIAELYRILDFGGQIYIQTPFTQGELFEDYTIRTKKDRLLQYGQADHVRIYTSDVLVERLQKEGFAVEILDYQEELENFNGFKVEEKVLVASKKSSQKY